MENTIEKCEEYKNSPPLTVKYVHVNMSSEITFSILYLRGPNE